MSVRFDLGSPFIYNGVSSAEFGVSIEEQGVDMPLLPETRERLVELATRHGAYDYGVYFKPLRFSLKCYIIANTHNNLMAQLSGLARLLNPLNGTKPLMLPDRDGIWDCRYSGVANLAVVVDNVKFTLPFLAPWPFPRAA